MGPRPAKPNKTEHDQKRHEKVKIYLIPSSKDKDTMRMFYVPNGPEVWLPKNQVFIGEPKSAKEPHIMTCELPLWLVQDKDLEDHVE